MSEKEINGVRVTSDFGKRNSPTAGASSNHKGVDLALPEGSPLASPVNGTIEYKIEGNGSKGYGYYAVIKSDDGHEYRFGHLSPFDGNQAGGRIEAGQVFAQSGNTGTSTGAHLHYEVRKDGVPIDPTQTNTTSTEPKTTEPVKESPTSNSSGSFTNDTYAGKAANILLNKGYNHIQAAGIVANLIQENAEFDPTKEGDNGKSVGIAQWGKARQAKFEEVMGMPVRNATVEQQLDFIDWELKNTHKSAGSNLANASSYEDAVRVIRSQYEQPKNKTGEEDKWRIDKGRSTYESFNGSTKSEPTNNTPTKSEPNTNSMSASDQFYAERKANLLSDANFKTYLDNMGVDTTNLSYKNVKAFKSAYDNKDATEKNAAVQANNQELLDGANPIAVYGDKFGRWAEKQIWGDDAAIDARRDEYLTEQSRVGMGIASGVANSVGNVADVLDNTSVGNYLGVDNNPSALKQYSTNTDAKFDDGSTSYKASKTIGEVAPALLVPTVGTGSILGTIAVNAALQGGAAYAMSDEGSRGTSAGIAAGVAGAIPVVGKAYTAAKAAGMSMLPDVRAGSLFKNAGVDSTKVNTAMATQLPNGVKPTLGLIDNAPPRIVNGVEEIPIKLDDLTQTARSQLNSNGGVYSVGYRAAQQYDQALANNVGATKSALNPTGMSSASLGDDISSVGASNLNARATDLNSKISSGLNDANLDTPINHSLKDDVFAAQLKLQNKNGSIPSELKNFVNQVNTKVDEVTTLKEGIAAIRELERNFAKQPEVLRESLTPYFTKVKETMGSTRSNNGMPFRPVPNVPESRAKLVLSDIEKLTDTGNTKVNLRDVAALKQLEDLPTKPSNPSSLSRVLPENSTKNFVGAKQSEKTFVDGKVKDKDFNNTSSIAERELVKLDAPEIKKAVEMLAKDMNRKGFVDQKIVDELSGKVGERLDKLAIAAITTGTISSFLSGSIGYIITGVLVSGGRLVKPTIVKELYIKAVSSHIVEAGVNPVYAEKLVNKYLKSTKGNAQLAKLTRKLSPVIGQAIIQATDTDN